MASDRIVKGALPRIEWGPVITGVLCAVAIHIVLGLFGTAFGLAAAPADSTGVGIGAGIWALLVPLIASAIGAFIAVRVAARGDAAGAHLHGALVWAIGLIAGALFITGTMATSAMTSATATSGNVRGGISARQARAPLTEARLDDGAKGAAAAAGAGGLGALLGLAGAFLGAAAGRRAVTGEGFGVRGGMRLRWERDDRRMRDERMMADDRRMRDERMMADDRRMRDERMMTDDRRVRSDNGGAAVSGTPADLRRDEVVRPGEDPTVHH